MHILDFQHRIFPRAALPHTRTQYGVLSLLITQIPLDCAPERAVRLEVLPNCALFVERTSHLLSSSSYRALG